MFAGRNMPKRVLKQSSANTLPTYGRFLEADPIGYGDGMNMYAYVGNDPVNGTDPTGLDGPPTQAELDALISQSYVASWGAAHSGSAGMGGDLMRSITLGLLESQIAFSVISGFNPTRTQASGGILRGPIALDTKADTSAKKDHCIRICSPILDRSQPPGSDRNTWDFHRCVNACMAADPNSLARISNGPSLLHSQPPASTSEISPWRVGGAILGSALIVAGVILLPEVAVPALLAAGASAR